MMNRKYAIDKHINYIRIDNSLRNDHSHAIRSMMLSSPTYQNDSYQDHAFLGVENGQTDKELRFIQKTMVAYSERL